MGKLGRNKPCHCGSGRKYKKCCLAKDEEKRRLAQEEERYERDVSLGRIDSFAGDEDWEEDPEEESEYDSAVDGEDGNNGYEREESDVVPDSYLPPAEVSPKYETVENNELSPDDMAVCEEWGTEYVKISDPDKLRHHIENFMDLHPDLIREIDLAGEPLFELGGMYVRQGRHQSYIDILNRLRTEFPDEYFRSFPYFDNDAIIWLVINGYKDDISELLNNYRRYPERNADQLFELIYFLMSWNCQDILTDFLRDVYKKVCSSPGIIGGNEIVAPVITTVMAPYLEQGIDKMDVGKLADEIKIFGDLVNPDWTDPEFLGKQIETILGRHEQWNLDDCRTRNQAIERYYDMTTDFMGWIVRNTGLDWCAAEYHRELVFEYLAGALPKKKKHRKTFPFAEKDMERQLIQLSENFMWLEPTRLFGFLNGIYLFQKFLVESLSLAPEEARVNMDSCVHLFEKSYPALLTQDFKALAWEKFPRDDMQLDG
jgi:hypothetical protein